MLKVYNKSALTRQQRFQNAVVTGLLAAVCCVAVIFVLHRIVHVFFDILYVGAGYLIGYVICRYGKGVQVRFSVLAVVLTLAVIIIGDMLIMGDLLVYNLYFATSSIDGLFYFGYRLAACLAAWYNARIAS